MNKSQGGQEAIADWQLCKGCKRSKITTTLSPCRHLASCGSCKSSMTRCPVCSMPVGFEEWQRCKGCKRDKISAVLQPCSHVASCNSCVSSMRQCPVCNKPVGSAVRNVKF